MLDSATNGGGSLEGSRQSDGSVHSSRARRADARRRGRHRTWIQTLIPSVLYDGPLVLLTSRFSASARRFWPARCRIMDAPLIVGDSSTFGKGTVQTILPLARIMDQDGLAHAFDPGALKVTIQQFYRPVAVDPARGVSPISCSRPRAIRRRERIRT